MRRSLKLALDEFGRATLEGEAARYSVSPGELVGNAVEYFLADRDSGRPALRVPRFARNASAPELEVDVDLGDRTWDEAESEATRQGVPLERLLEHAAMYLVADLDSGEVAGRIAADATIVKRSSP
jgi:hypothetical protein